MLQFDPKQIKPAEVQRLLQGGIAPRPIALVSTITASGNVNLSPFSFFNVFSSNPPVVGFSAARRGRDGTLKDTYNNIIETGECVIQAVTFDMVEQVSLASTEYDPDVNEFVKSGFTPLDSIIVKPPRVKESPFQMECRLVQMINLGTEGGAGNLALCEVLLIHADERIFTNNTIDPQKIDLVSRMSADYYCRAWGAAVFELEKPLLNCLSGNDLGKLANIEYIPSTEHVSNFNERILNKFKFTHAPDLNQFEKAIQSKEHEEAAAVLLNTSLPSGAGKLFAEAARCALRNNSVLDAWCILLSSEKSK
ncbi:MAG: flavin reductase family protein [Ignavibacteriales bacterium]|nr:flavin reductase family protein [Ignavibacteriales bacterium]